MKRIVTETALETKFWSAAIRAIAYILQNGFTVPQPRPVLFIFIRNTVHGWSQLCLGHNCVLCFFTKCECTEFGGFGSIFKIFRKKGE